MKKNIIVNAPGAQRFLHLIQMTADAVAWVINKHYADEDSYTQAALMANHIGSAWCDENGWHHMFMEVPEHFDLESYKYLKLTDDTRIDFPNAKEILFPDYVRPV